MSTPNAVSIQRKTHMETVDEFLARGGRVERIEGHPDPEGRVLLRGQRERQRQFGSEPFPHREPVPGRF
jgi:hypothetical protein